MASSSNVDKSWIRSQNKASLEFTIGVEAFLDFVEEKLDSGRSSLCPCDVCKNNRRLKFDVVRAHIYKNGFWEDYVVWDRHGEAAVEEPDVVEPVQGRPEIEDVEMEPMLFDMLNTASGPEYENMGAPDGPAEHRGGVYEKLFREMETELYPGFTKMGSLNFIAKLMHIKVKNKWTNKSFTDLLELLSQVLPDGHNLPASYGEANARLKNLGLGYETIDVCLNDCALYWKENAALEFCPVCGESRWDPKKGKKVSHKKMRYFPLTPRLQRLFASRHTSQHMIWHHISKPRDEDVLRHPVDGASWKEFDTRHPLFASEPRNVRLGLATDGFCPFSMQNNPYSMWPVILTTYNLPPWMCMKESTFMLTLLIPGSQNI